jgi:hypothetical protein
MLKATSDGLAGRGVLGIGNDLADFCWESRIILELPVGPYHSEVAGELESNPVPWSSAFDTSDRIESIDGISLIVVTDDIRECASERDVLRDARLLWLSENLCPRYSGSSIVPRVVCLR